MTLAAPVGDLAGRGAVYWGDRVAVVDGGRRFTYVDLDRRATAVAAWLASVGVDRGDRVAILARNGVEHLDVFLACGKLGAVHVPLNWRLHPEEHARTFGEIGAKVLVFHDAFAETAARFVGPSAHLDGAGVGSVAWDAVLATTALTPAARLDPEDLAALLFTGGTTGQPKAACVSWRMIAANTLATMIHEVDRHDVTITHTPMFHTGGLLVYTVPLLHVGGTVVILESFDAGALLRAVRDERVTLMFCVPTQVQMMLEHPDFPTADLSSLRFLTSGGAPLPVPLIERFRAVHDVPFKQGFGMTEFGPGVFSMEARFAVAKTGSIGRPNFGVSARLVDAEGVDVRVGEVGELWLAGPAMCSGYFGAPEASDEAMRDGWLRTGDLARVDRDGFFFLVGRKKDMFISGGENVYPPEIEQALLAHPAVRAAAVVGVPDPRWGEVGRAFVVGDVDPAALLEWLRGRLARYKVPKEVRLVEALPLTAAGKVDKRALSA